MRQLLPIAVLAACQSPSPDARWHAILVNGGGSAEINYRSHRDHLSGMTDALVQRGLSVDDITVLASDGADPEPDLLSMAPLPDPGDIPVWAVGPGALMDPGAPLAHLWPDLELIDTAWSRTEVAPATVASLATTLAATPVSAGDRLLLYTTDHGELDGSLSLWNETLAPEHFAALLTGVPQDVRVVVAMSQCHSGAFAEPLLAARAAGVDVCGIFSVPADRQATGCFPDQDGAPIGHGFQISKAWSGADTVTGVHDHLIGFDRGPDVPIRTSDVYLWSALMEAAEQRGEDVTITVDRLLAMADPSIAPGARLQLAVLADRLGRPVPQRLAAVQALTARWGSAIESAAMRVEDLSLAHQDAVLLLQQEALDKAKTASPSWADLLRDAAQQTGLAEEMPRLLAARETAEAQLWTWTVQEAVLARMGWLLVRVAGRALLESDAELEALLACEDTPLGGSPTSRQDPPWSASGAVPEPVDLAWVGVRLESDPQGRPTVLAVHPEGPAAGVLEPGERIVSMDGTVTPTVEGVVVRLALSVPGRAWTVETDRGSRAIETIAWPASLLPAVVPDAGDVAPSALAWLTTPPVGAHLIVWTADQCPTCGPAVERSRSWAAAMDHSLVVVDDVIPSGLPDALVDLGGWSADAFAIELLPSVVAVDAAGRIAWRVDGWSPEEGIDLPLVEAEKLDQERFPRTLVQPSGSARGTPVP